MIHPTPNKVLVLPDEPATRRRSSSGFEFEIPANERKIPNFGTIVACGILRGDHSEEKIIVGGRYLWHPNWYQQEGYELKIDGRLHYIFHINMILGRFTKVMAVETGTKYRVRDYKKAMNSSTDRKNREILQWDKTKLK